MAREREEAQQQIQNTREVSDIPCSLKFWQTIPKLGELVAGIKEFKVLAN